MLAIGLGVCAGAWSAGCSDANVSGPPSDAGGLLPDAVVLQADAGPEPLPDASLTRPPATIPATTSAQELCPELGVPCSAQAWSTWSDAWETLLEARDLGDGTRFRALSGRAVLAESGDGEWFVLRLRFSWERSPPQVTRHALPTGERGVALTDAEDETLVLSCSTPDQDCVILRISLGAAQPTVNVPPVHRSIEARGLYRNPSEGVCVYGRGLWCLRGSSWVSQLPEAAQIRDVKFIGPYTVLETHAGVYWVSSDDPALKPGFEQRADLLQLAPAVEGPSSWTQLMGQQLWYWTGRELAACPSTPALVMRLPFRALAVDGTVFGYDLAHHHFCVGQQLTLPGPVVGTSHPMCGIVTNSFVLTESVLFGTLGCAVD